MENNLTARCTVTINNETIADTVTNINDSKEISNPLVIGPVNEDGDCIIFYNIDGEIRICHREFLCDTVSEFLDSVDKEHGMNDQAATYYKAVEFAIMVLKK